MQSTPLIPLPLFILGLCGGGGGDLLLIGVDGLGDLRRHILLVMLSQDLGGGEEAADPPGLLSHGRRRLLIGILQGPNEALDDDRVAFTEQVREGALVADKDVGDEVGNDELHEGGGGGPGDAASRTSRRRGGILTC
ncbi:hypothetical protein Scep_012845 [Stephania cephalantha]|uniref:Uncharacterized protein n=1 Tax=Stephania cephalantha TaxID=152367 RepID=A0AAP0JGA6_9MAGN